MADNAEFSTTFMQDFAFAEMFGGMRAVLDTFNRAFKEWRTDYRYLTDLVITLNQYLWDAYNRGDMRLAKLYDTLWRKASDYAVNNLHGEELAYYYRLTD